ncbi:hypothetical protein [Rugamonas apoptosis]|uniref:Integrase catalytic domain-containing protein n=1 Tax=Rugamonas apoptosis TaxID=2758570 RepID=A0A7W2IJA5_9BURK|nr:hypothetical protein [Rugamonas apoptosis]MBA5686314.1 hypothetical protein [Rugamonas apoptosis]
MQEDFKTGQVFKIGGIEKPQRVILASKLNDYVIAINLMGKRCVPTKFGYAALRSQWEVGELVKLEDPNPIFSDYLTEKNKAVVDERMAAIAPIVGNIEYVLNSKERKKAIDRLAVELGISAERLNNWVITYWQRGCHELSLINMYHKCGGAGKTRTASAKNAEASSEKRGRKAYRRDGAGINVTPEIRSWIFQARKHYFRTVEATKQDAYDMLLLEKFQDALELDEAGEIFNVDLGRCISYDQFLYWYQRDVSVEEEKREKYGEKHYALNNRPITSDSRGESIAPGFRGQMDSTRGDMQLVASWSRLEPIGRPTVYFLIDVVSGLIGAIYISLENPSGESAIRTLLNALEDKVEFCKKFGINITSEEWPTMGIPSYLSTDKGPEFMSQMMERFAKLGGKENPPAYRADLRGVVERMFAELRRTFVQAEGFVDRDAGKRGSVDSRLKAAWNLEEFTKQVVLWVIEHNNSVNKNYPDDPYLIADGVPTVPAKIWQWGVDNIQSRNREVSHNELIALLYEEKSGSLNQGVLEFKGRFYESEEYMQNAETQNALVNLEVGTVHFDPAALKVVYLRHPTINSRFVRYELNVGLDMQNKMSLVELELLREKKQQNNAPAKAKETAGRLNRKKFGADTNKKATKEKKAAGPDGRGKAAKIAAIDANRAIEAAKQKAKEEPLIIAGGGGAPSTPNGEVQPVSSGPSIAAPEAASELLEKDVRRYRRPYLISKPFGT